MKNFLSWSIAAVLVTMTGAVSSAHPGQLSPETINVDAKVANFNAPETSLPPLPSTTTLSTPKISFGLPKVPVRNLPDELNNQVDDRINQVESQIRDRLPNVLLPLIKEHFLSRERARILEWSNYLGLNLSSSDPEPSDISTILTAIAATTGDRYGLVYISYYEGQGLEFLLFAPGDSEPQSLYTVDISQQQLESLVDKFRYELLRSVGTTNDRYLETSKQLYDALINPIDDYLKANQIEGLIFAMDQGLRDLPIAALYDGEDYLIEDYSIAIIPSFMALNNNYVELNNAPVLAMGAETFPTLNPLPGAGLEVEAVADISTGEGFLNDQFTVANLNAQRHSNGYPIVHFATHASFADGSPDQSYIHLWNDKLTLNELEQLRLSDPPVELLVLSACETAIGSYEAELGFAGLTIASGAKSALGSLWSVSDQGTMVLMQSFYNYLRTEPTKADALRRAQLDLLRGDLRVLNGQVLDRSGTVKNVKLSPDLGNVSLSELSHPYYWSGFTMIGQPW